MMIQQGGSSIPNHHRDYSAPTAKQLAALERYAEDPSVPAPVRHGIVYYLNGLFTFDSAFETIGMIKTFQTGGLPARKPVTEPGIYVDPGTGAFYLVRISQANRLYAMDLVIHEAGERNPDGTWKIKPRFEWLYKSGHATLRKLSSEWKMTPEQAKQFGDLFSHCIKCHIELTKQESIERGMGKTCWEKAF